MTQSLSTIRNSLEKTVKTGDELYPTHKEEIDRACQTFFDKIDKIDHDNPISDQDLKNPEILAAIEGLQRSIEELLEK